MLAARRRPCEMARRSKQDRALPKIHVTLTKIFTRAAVLLFGFAVAIGSAAEATPLASDRDMVTGISVTEADCRAEIGRLWVKVENRGFCALLDVRVAMAAADTLKRHYGFKRFHLVGQSGGGHAVAGLVQLRSDIGCAVIASGGTSLRSSQRDSGHPFVGKHRFYDPIDHVNTMRQRPGLRLFVVSDRKDKLVSYHSQLGFVERVRAHNFPITHEIATATDKSSHGLFALGHQIADNCTHDLWKAEEVERAWAVSKDTTTIAVLEEFVRNYGDIPYATLARARMEELRKSQAAAQPTLPSGFNAGPRPPGANGENVTPAPAAPPLVLPQPSVAATILHNRVKTETIRTDGASRPTAVAPVERLPSKPAPAPRQAKPRGSEGRCFVLGGRSFCE